MKLSTPDDEDERDEVDVDVEIEDAQDSDEISPSNPVATGAVEDDLASEVEQLRDEIEAVRRGQSGLRERLSVLETRSDRRQWAIAELQAGFEKVAEKEGWTVKFEYDLRE